MSNSTAAPATTTATPIITDEACRYTSLNRSAAGCLTLRSCRECLVTTGCRIAIDGFCEAARPNAKYDYHNAFNVSLVLPEAQRRNATDLQWLQEWQFPASDALYCPANDATCIDCTQQRFWLGEHRMADSRFCVGAGGCVCVANCARADNATKCTSPPSSSEMENSGDAITKVLTWLAVIGILLVVLVVGCLAYCCYDIQRDRRKLKAEATARAARDVGTPITRVDHEYVTIGGNNVGGPP